MRRRKRRRRRQRRRGEEVQSRVSFAFISLRPFPSPFLSFWFIYIYIYMYLALFIHETTNELKHHSPSPSSSSAISPLSLLHPPPQLPSRLGKWFSYARYTRKWNRADTITKSVALLLLLLFPPLPRGRGWVGRERPPPTLPLQSVEYNSIKSRTKGASIYRWHTHTHTHTCSHHPYRREAPLLECYLNATWMLLERK